jgi:copper chaperone CopZ
MKISDVPGNGKKQCPQCLKYVGARNYKCPNCNNPMPTANGEAMVRKTQPIKKISDVGGQGKRQCPKCLKYVGIRNYKCPNCGNPLPTLIKKVPPKKIPPAPILDEIPPKEVKVEPKKYDVAFDNRQWPIQHRVEVEASQSARVCGCKNVILITPPGGCPHRLGGTDPDTVMEWANKVVEAGHNISRHFAPAALRYFVREFYPVDTIEHGQVCQLLLGFGCESGTEPSNGESGTEPSESEAV